MRFALAPRDDVDVLAARFAASGRVRVPGLLLEADALALHAELRRREDWRQVVNSGDKVFDLDRPTRAAMSAEQTRALDDAVHAGGRAGFQYRYEAIRVPDGATEREAGGDALAALARFLGEGEGGDLVRRVTGDAAIAWADAQATAFSPGDFLTAHDDAVAGKGRRAAYVLGLNPRWRVEWGGLLLFHGSDGDVEAGWTPAFNSLALFRVPQMHSVSYVTRSAAYRRYSVTGWLREAGAR